MKKQLLALTVAAALLATGIFAVVSVSAEPANPSPEESAANFDVLDGLAAAGPQSLDGLEAMTDLGEASGLDVAPEVKAVDAEGGTVLVSATADEAGACLASPSIVTCGELFAAEGGRMFGLASCTPGLEPGQVEIAGLVPDGVEGVSVNVDGSGDVEIAVVENVVSEAVDGYPVSVEWTGPDGSVNEAELPGEPAMLECG